MIFCRAKSKKPCGKKNYVGVTGFEPVTSTLSTESTPIFTSLNNSTVLIYSTFI